MIDNKTYNITIHKSKEELEQEKKRLWLDINEILIPKQLEKSEVYYTLDEKKAECWRELLKFLLQIKCININMIKEVIESEKGLKQ